jgi:hypothetical protein
METSQFEKAENPLKNEYVTLQEASIITGLKIQTLRSRIKRGKLEASQHPSQKGLVWYVKLSSLAEFSNIDMSRLNFLEPSFENLLNREPSQTELRTLSNNLRTFSKNENLLNEVKNAQDQHIDTLLRTNKMYENLLTIFQERVNVLEEYNFQLENKIKLLPAPPEEIVDTLKDKEEKLNLVEDILKEEKKKNDEILKEKLEIEEKFHQEAKFLNETIEKVESDIKNCEANFFKEKKELEEKLKKEIEDKEKIKKELDFEKSRPWWKKIFSR